MKGKDAFATRAWALGASLLVVVALLVYAAAVLTSFNLKVVDDDQALYWLMSEDVLHLRLHLPFVYGQAYNLAPEIYPAALLMATGRWAGFAVAVTATGTGFLAWAFMALFAYRMGRGYLALVLLMAPLLLPVPYTMELGRPENSGVLVASLALCALTVKDVRLRGFLFGSLAALAYAIHPNSVLLTIPAGVYLVLGRPSKPAMYIGLALGAGLGLALLRLGVAAASTDPDWLIHGSPALAWSLPLFVEGLRGPSTYFGRMVPWFLVNARALPAVLLLLTLLAAARRQLAAAAAAGTALVVIVASLGLSKAHDGDTGVFFSYQRLFLAVPETLAFVLVIVAPVAPIRRPRLVLGAAVALALVSLPVQLLSIPAATARYTPPGGRFQGVTNARVSQPLVDRCHRIAADMSATGTRTFVQLGDRAEAYACEALVGGSIQTYYPPYDRRGWVADVMAQKPEGRVFFSDVSVDLCSRAEAVGATCEVTDPPLAVGVIDLKGRTVGEFLRLVNIPVLEPAKE